MLLVGGSEVNALFFKNNLIDKLHLTIEPRMFGLGKKYYCRAGLCGTIAISECRKIK